MCLSKAAADCNIELTTLAFTLKDYSTTSETGVKSSSIWLGYHWLSDMNMLQGNDCM